MKVTLKVEQEFEAKTLHVRAEVRYWEDSIINGQEDTANGDNVPCKNGDYWMPIINIDTGIIENWHIGVTASIHYKVVDGCGWQIIDDCSRVLLGCDDGYVPDTLAPNDDAPDGDYIIMDIDENGKIFNWNFNLFDFYKED